MRNSAVGRLLTLRGVTWRWRDDVPTDMDQGSPMGVVAQDVEAEFPELIHVDERGFKTVNYTGLIAPLIEAVRELDERLRAVEERLERLDGSGPGG
jgi:hypothetical protein